MIKVPAPDRLLRIKWATLLFALSASCAYGDQFTVEGSSRGDKHVVISYDPKDPDIADTGPELLLLDTTGRTVAKFPPLGADWSWSGPPPEGAVYQVGWSDDSTLLFVRYRAGRILTGFSVFRLKKNSLTEIDVRGTVRTLYEKGQIGDPPRSPNNSGVHVIAWISASTILCDAQTADDRLFVTVTINQQNRPRITNMFQVNDSVQEH